MGMERYRYEAFPVVVAFTLIMLGLLYKFMSPVKRAQKR